MVEAEHRVECAGDVRRGARDRPELPVPLDTLVAAVRGAGPMRLDLAVRVHADAPEKMCIPQSEASRGSHSVVQEHRESASISIDAPLDTVWELLCQLDRYVEWVESTLAFIASDGHAALGASYVERSRISGFWTATIRWHVVEIVPSLRIVFEGAGVAPVTGLGYSVEVAPDDDRTEFTLTLWYTPRFGPVGALVEMAVRSNVNAEHRRSVRTFSILAEHDGQPPT